MRRHKEITLGFDSIQPQSVSHSSTVLPFIHPDDMLTQSEMELLSRLLYSIDDRLHEKHTNDLQGIAIHVASIIVIVVVHSA